MMPDIGASSLHHREARRQSMEGQASTSDQPFPIHMDTQEDVQEDQMEMEKGITDMLHNFF